MGLIVTLTGDAGKYLIRGAIWELGASSYRAYVHLVPPGPPSRPLPVGRISRVGNWPLLGKSA
jgi:hypothetical protein